MNGDWPHQTYGVQETIRRIDSGVKSLCLSSPTGGGKCFRRGTPILMFDGTIKAVEDVVVGDELMGPDSRPRMVLALGGGFDEMYRVTPVKGDSYVVNADHILALKFTGGTHLEYEKYKHSEFCEITVRDYIAMSNSFKHVTKGYRVAVEFQCKDVPIDPYYLGIWLGDGTAKSTQISKPDREISDCVASVAEAHGGFMVSTNHPGKCAAHSIKFPLNGTRRRNVVLDILRGLNVIQNKHVPQIYKSNSRSVRLEVLAGLLDTDGHLGHSGFDYISKDRRLAEDCAFLARSLGLAAYILPCEKQCINNGVWGVYYRVSISGDCSMIPTRIPRKQSPPRKQKKDVLVTGIKVEPVGEDHYYGFEIDGDGLFLLGDFTVTHNTKMGLRLIEWAVEKGWNVAVFTNRRLLTNQLAVGLSRDGIRLGVRAAEFEAWTDVDAPVQICSTPTEVARVIKPRSYMRDTKLFPAKLIIIDEVHLNSADSMTKIVREYQELHDSVVVGVSATPLGVSHLCDELIVAGNNSELRECGALVAAHSFEPAVVDLPKIRRTKSGVFSQKELEDATKAIWSQHIVGHILTHWKMMRPEGKSCLGMAPGVKESLGLAQEFWKHGINAAHISSDMIYVDGKEYSTNNQEDRDELFARSKSGEVPMIWNRFVLREAIDLPWLEMLTLATPIAGLLGYIQTIGRVLRASPSTGKTKAIVVDHAGTIRMHGSPNMDRDDQWKRYFYEAEDKVTKDRLDGLRDPDNKEAEPITCPQCGKIRQSGPKCPECGYACSHSVRKVIQEDGRLVPVKDAVFPKRHTKMTPTTLKLWEACYFRCKNSRKKSMSFKQARALFKYENRYWPPMDLPLMPKNKGDWSRKIKDVRTDDLYPRHEGINNG